MKIEKSGYFQKLLYIALQKFRALRFFQTPRLIGLDIFPDPTVICNPTFIREIRVVKRSKRPLLEAISLSLLPCPIERTKLPTKIF